MTPRIKRRTLAALGVPAAALGALAFTLAPAASAAPLPSYGLHPESFTISINGHGPGVGLAAGPVHGRFADYTVTARDDVFAFAHGKVNVLHTAVGNPKIDPATCSGFLFQQGRWQFRGLTGDERHATGYGRFDVFESVQLGRDRYGQCDPKRADVDVYVIGWGQAANPQYDH